MIKKDPELGIIPVIVMTAESKSEVDCLKLGAADFISKPYLFLVYNIIRKK